MLRLSGQAVY